MSTSAMILAPIAATLLPAMQKTQEYLENARSRNTIRGYRSDWKQFERWCVERGISALPATPDSIAVYLSDRAGILKTSTLEHHLSAIAKAHKTAGHPSPVKDNPLIAETLKGIKRIHGMAPVQKAPVLTDDLRACFARHGRALRVCGIERCYSSASAEPSAAPNWSHSIART